MFRPDQNMNRMNQSATRLTLPNFEGDALVEGIKELLRVEESWIPTLPGYSLYIRPTMISNHDFLGVGCVPAPLRAPSSRCRRGPLHPRARRSDFDRARHGGHRGLLPPLPRRRPPSVCRCVLRVCACACV